MKELKLSSCQQAWPKYKTAHREHVCLPNLLERQFAVTAPEKVWCSDISYIVTNKNWNCMTVVMHLCSQNQWLESANKYDTTHIRQALRMA